MQKWGKNRNGSVRFRCFVCQKTGTRKRPDIVSTSHNDLYQTWLLSKFTLSDFALKYDVTRRTLDRWFTPFRTTEIVSKVPNTAGTIFIIDGYYLEFGATVLIAQLVTNQTVDWLFTYAENFTTWLELFNRIHDSPFAVVCDGQKGMLKALRTRWPRVVIQRCQFHVIHQVNILLTKHPELVPAQHFQELVGAIIRVKTRDDLKQWLTHYKQWYKQFGNFLKERTYQQTLTPTGRPKWSYTHGHLHQTHSHLKNALPNLFQYIHYPNIPNTSNRIEGGINAQIQRHIDFHRGTNLFQRRQIIAALLKQTQCGKLSKKPTQNVT